ncbi:hypothetical protein [Microvirga massiliensis]|uniref:hypothetical protein n=1 Tax=Microvirga massiliensis TaxID=1033741 RepID=UPI00062B9F45|nr:hypothetical protein [Microvirga massiliensis]
MLSLFLIAEAMMSGNFSSYLQEVARHLPAHARRLVTGDLNLTVLAWFTEGVASKEAARRIRRALEE